MNKMWDDSRKPFIETLHNKILPLDLCNSLFSIIVLMNSGQTCLFHKGFCTVYFESKKKNAVTLQHSAQRKHAFLGKSWKSQRKTNYQQKRKLL